MSVRHRLNEAYATGAVILAAFLGLVFNSWWVFGVGLGVLLLLKVLGGQIRVARTGHRR